VRLALVVSGSRGDVQPMLAIALGLEAAGHEALVCTSPENEALARRLGCRFAAVGDAIHGNPELRGGGLRALNRFAGHQAEIQARDLPALLDGYDRVLATGLVFGVRPVAERLGIPYRFVAFSPATMLGTTADGPRMRLLGRVSSLVADRMYGSALTRARTSLGLPRVRDAAGQLIGSAPIAATDPALTIVPAAARLRATQTGYPMLGSVDEPSDRLRRFLADGPPPVYAGFGSMPVADRTRLAETLVAAARATGQRLVVCGGWAGITGPASTDACLFTDDEPHAWLFPRVRAVIHHGGAGTVASAARAGLPQVVLPQAADQFAWRSVVVRLGLGPSAPMLRRVGVGGLTRALAAVVEDGRFAARAAAVAEELAAAPDGVAATVAEAVRVT
jgi:vancomycin aglycone glucosyltransferase